MRNRSWLLAAAILSAAPVICRAQDAASSALSNSEAETEGIVVSATRIETPEREMETTQPSMPPVSARTEKMRRDYATLIESEAGLPTFTDPITASPTAETFVDPTGPTHSPLDYSTQPPISPSSSSLRTNPVPEAPVAPPPPPPPDAPKTPIPTRTPATPASPKCRPGIASVPGSVSSSHRTARATARWVERLP